jgi:hypothetical protein
VKTDPTKSDREATSLFLPEHGMLIRQETGGIWRPLRVDDSYMEDFGGEVLPVDHVIDTDDAATIGVMYSQIMRMDCVCAVFIGDKILRGPYGVVSTSSRVSVVTFGVSGVDETIERESMAECLCEAMSQLLEARRGSFMQ